MPNHALYPITEDFIAEILDHHEQESYIKALIYPMGPSPHAVFIEFQTLNYFFSKEGKFNEFNVY